MATPASMPSMWGPPILSIGARATLRQVHVPQGRPGLAPPARRPARRRQARVPGRLRGLRGGAAAARVLDRRHARRHRPDAAQPGHEPPADPRVPRRPGAERADEVVLDALLVPGDDEAVGVLGRVAARGPAGARPLPVRVPVRQDARVVRQARRRALEDHAGAHPRRPRVPRHRPQHVVLVRARRPGVRRCVRGRRPGALPRPRAAAPHDRGLRVHQTRHADVHVRVDVGRAGALRPRRHAPLRGAADRMRQALLLVALLAAAVLALGGCGGDDCGGGAASDGGDPVEQVPTGLQERVRAAQDPRPSEFPKPGGKTLQALADEIGGGPQMGLAGSVFLAGQENRVAFGVIDSDAGFLYGKTALYVAPTPGSKAKGPYVAPADVLVTDPPYRSEQAATEADPFAAVYAARVPLGKPGSYSVMAVTLVGGKPVAA